MREEFALLYVRGVRRVTTGDTLTHTTLQKLHEQKSCREKAQALWWSVHHQHHDVIMGWMARREH